MSELLTASEAAERLGFSPRRVRDLIDEGRFPGAEKRGRDWLLPESDVAGFQRKTPGRPRKPVVSEEAAG